MGSLVDKKDDGRLGVWFAVSNLGAGGLMMILAGQVISRLAPVLAGMLMGSSSSFADALCFLSFRRLRRIASRLGRALGDSIGNWSRC